MKPANMAALLLTAMALVGMTYSTASQRAFAHNFSEDESANFLVDIWAAKVHLMLVSKNLANPDAALEHIEHVHMIINDEWLNEIAERNERIAADIPAALDDLALMIERGENRSVIASQFRDISNLLAEAVSVRIDRDHVDDPHIQVLIVAGLVDNALVSYEQAHGISSGHGHAGEEHEEDGLANHHEIVNHDAYTAARTFATLAKNTFFKEKLVNEGSEKAYDAQSALVNLRHEIYAKHSLDDVTIAVHIEVHENLRQGFGLEFAGHPDDHAEVEHDNGHGEEDGHM